MAIAGLQPVSARAARVFDDEYAYRTTKQRDWIRRRVRQIIAPTITFPAMAATGGKFGIQLRRRRGLEAGNRLVRKTGLWVVQLRHRTTGVNHPCTVRKVTIRGRFVRLLARGPVNLARDVYDLHVVGPGIDDTQPNAVRIYGPSQPEAFRFAVISDHQLWDPSFKVKGRQINSGLYPRRGAKHGNMAISLQGLSELSLHDPEFVLHLGDLLFGVNYPQEYDEAYKILQQARLPIFAIPGNHDAYADYVVKLRGGAVKLLSSALGCRQHLAKELSWEQAWIFITCVYGDVKERLYADLHRDGLFFWRRQLGPPAFAFDFGQLRFVGINTYDGTPERRHAFSIYMDVLDLHLGAPAVDNYGGYLTDGQLKSIEAEARLAASRGQTLVVFGHHDPRGNAAGKRYHENQAFPTDPVGLGGFEEWNFDSTTWDSAPGDGRSGETASRHSGHALIRILAKYGGYYLHGHAHQDGRRVYAPGSTLAGIKVQERLEFIRTTTAASSCNGEGYWGYRLIEVAGKRFRTIDYSPEHHLASVPAGNIWVEKTAGTDERVVVSGLPRLTRLTLRWDLPTRAKGFRFRLRADPDSDRIPLPKKMAPRVTQVSRTAARTTYWVEVSIPAAPYPPVERTLVRQRFRALVARENEPPAGKIDLFAADGLKLQPLDDGFDVAIGQPLLLTAERSADKEGDRILSYLWKVGEEREARGQRVVHTFSGPGRRVLTLTLMDEAGATSTIRRTVNVQPPRPPGCQGCCADDGGVNAVTPPMLFSLILLLGLRWRTSRFSLGAEDDRPASRRSRR